MEPLEKCTDSMVHGANMGPIWGRQGPGGSHVGPMNFAIWVDLACDNRTFKYICMINIQSISTENGTRGL